MGDIASLRRQRPLGRRSGPGTLPSLEDLVTPAHRRRAGTFMAVDLFAGCGGNSLGIAMRGGVEMAAYDFMREAVESLVANGFPGIQADVREVDFTVHRGADVVTGGPPCQPFSQGGRNGGDSDERDMIPQFIRAVDEIRPQFFIMENVRGLAGPRHRDYLEARVEQMEDLGYRVERRVLDAADYGVPQSRRRLFVLGRRLDGMTRSDVKDRPRWPQRVARHTTMAKALRWNRDMARIAALQAPVYGDPDWVFQRPSTTVVGSFMPHIQAAPGYRGAGDGPRQNAPGSVVTTHAERLVLQGFPSDWKLVGSKTKRDLQIGNSCPPAVIAAILEANGF